MVEKIVSKLVGILSFGKYHFTEVGPPSTRSIGNIRCRQDCWCDAFSDRLAERNYGYILDDWKKEVKNTYMRNPKKRLYLYCRETSLRYSDRKRELQRMVDQLKEHPREAHWHIPNHIRSADFLNFVRSATPTQLKKLKYLYEVDPR